MGRTRSFVAGVRESKNKLFTASISFTPKEKFYKPWQLSRLGSSVLAGIEIMAGLQRISTEDSGTELTTTAMAAATAVAAAAAAASATARALPSCSLRRCQQKMI